MCGGHQIRVCGHWKVEEDGEKTPTARPAACRGLEGSRGLVLLRGERYTQSERGFFFLRGLSVASSLQTRRPGNGAVRPRRGTTAHIKEEDHNKRCVEVTDPRATNQPKGEKTQLPQEGAIGYVEDMRK